MKTVESVKAELFAIVDKYIMRGAPNIDFSDEDRMKIRNLNAELKMLQESERNRLFKA